MLLRFNASKDAMDGARWAPLHYAIRSITWDIIRELPDSAVFEDVPEGINQMLLRMTI
jgi:hypothetical protein